MSPLACSAQAPLSYSSPLDRCLEACYLQLRGVTKVESGYAAGHVANPTYKQVWSPCTHTACMNREGALLMFLQVCGGDTGHAEVVQVTFDPSVITLLDVLHVFFTLHDPTTKDR